MQRCPAFLVRMRAKAFILCAGLLAGALAGCVCSDAELDAFFGEPEYFTEYEEDCQVRDLAHLSKASAHLAGRADPQMLELARLEVEKDCYRTAAIRARQRLSALEDGHERRQQ